jgi:hypothetical protein
MQDELGRFAGSRLFASLGRAAREARRPLPALLLGQFRYPIRFGKARCARLVNVGRPPWASGSGCTLLGRVPCECPLRDIFVTSDAFLFISLRDSAASVLVEAMAARIRRGEKLPSSELASSIVAGAAKAGLFVQMPFDLDRIRLTNNVLISNRRRKLCWNSQQSSTMPAKSSLG